jgi:hypothetical protein
VVLLVSDSNNKIKNHYNRFLDWWPDWNSTIFIALISSVFILLASTTSVIWLKKEFCIDTSIDWINLPRYIYDRYKDSIFLFLVLLIPLSIRQLKSKKIGKFQVGLKLLIIRPALLAAYVTIILLLVLHVMCANNYAYLLVSVLNWGGENSGNLQNITYNFLKSTPIEVSPNNLNSLLEVAVGLTLAFSLFNFAEKLALDIVSKQKAMLDDPTFAEALEVVSNRVFKEEVNNKVSDAHRVQIEKAISDWNFQSLKYWATVPKQLTIFSKGIGFLAALLFLVAIVVIAQTSADLKVHSASSIGILMATVTPIATHFLLMYGSIKAVDDGFCRAFLKVLPSGGIVLAKQIRSQVLREYKRKRESLEK